MAGSPRSSYDNSMVLAEYLVAECSVAESQVNGYDDNVRQLRRLVATSLTLSPYLTCRSKAFLKILAVLAQEQDSYKIYCKTHSQSVLQILIELTLA